MQSDQRVPGKQEHTALKNEDGGEADTNTSPPSHGCSPRVRSTAVYRWGLCAVPLLVLLIFWGGQSARADSPPAGSCHTEQLTAAQVDVELTIANHTHNTAEGRGVMTVRVPRSWEYAEGLLLQRSSVAYRDAMHCLLRDEQESGRPPEQYLRQYEWRSSNPAVSTEPGLVKVEYPTIFWFDHGGTFLVGPWEIDVQPGQWKLSLVPPTALAGARWNSVKVDLGGLEASSMTPEPSTAGNGSMVWSDPDPPQASSSLMMVQVAPPWQRAWAAVSSNDAPLLVSNKIGQATWWVVISAIVAVAALRARRRPAHDEATALEIRSSTVLLQWGVASAVIILTFLLPQYALLDQRWMILTGILVGWALTATARPKRSVLLAASLVAAAGGLVAAWPSLFSLPESLSFSGTGPVHGFAPLVATTAALLWLWLTGLALWMWRLACEGGLIRPPTSPWRLRRVGPGLAVATLLLLGWQWWTQARGWERASWLSNRAMPEYGWLHRSFLNERLVSYATQIPSWCASWTWVLTGIAVVALLRARDLAFPVPRAYPTRLDRLLLAVFFAVVVAYRQGSFAGSQAVAVLWLVLDIAGLYALLAVGSRWAVLAHHLEGSGNTPRLSEAITEASRSGLIVRARRYRELTDELRDMGKSEGAAGRHAAEKERHAMERELSGLHRWRSPTGTADTARAWLPGQYTIMDVALSWGPHARWWENARRAALLAAAFGLPGTLVILWFSYQAEQTQWMYTAQDSFGAPNMVRLFLTLELASAGAGLVLGGLWRLLPGRRGPARALSLVAVYTLLIVMGTLGDLITDQPLGNVAIATCQMLLVLTLTGLAMDADTFHAERRLWPSRFGLLLWIYQLRGFSAQIAYVLAQLGALIVIAKFFIGPDIRSMKPP
ncbi:DUF6185 family protein [Kitasatospora sp. NPDC057542]|uniref:DUF6185 family protein n=1 Tax=Kitasatospora sp. NPDC057542 TaxID=3346162 RepID=UPI003694BDDD